MVHIPLKGKAKRDRVQPGLPSPRAAIWSSLQTSATPRLEGEAHILRSTGSSACQRTSIWWRTRRVSSPGADSGEPGSGTWRLREPGGL
jgi:hypothetical protein